MNMLEIGKITAFALASALCAVVLRKQAREIAMVLALAGVTIILGYCLDVIGSIRTIMERLTETAEISPAVAAPVIKTVGISILTRFGAELCKDAKENGLAAAVELAGTVAALYLAAPLMQLVLDMIEQLL